MTSPSDTLHPDDTLECRTCRPPRLVKVASFEAHCLMLHVPETTIWENQVGIQMPEVFALIWADRDPDRSPLCAVQRDGYACTREPQHAGRHVATSGQRAGQVVAAWPGERRLEPGDLG